jgi:hypothetical protein
MGRFRSVKLLLVAVAALASSGILLAQNSGIDAVTVLETSRASRDRYLAEATIWEARALPSPAAILEGPLERFAMTRAQANPPDGFPCTFESNGESLGGRTPKLGCRTSDGVRLRVKYFDPDGKQGNREVFAEVLATRLVWALGFDADATYPVTINCLDCPADPMTGRGPRASRKLLGTVEPRFRGASILSGTDLDQGWTFGELDSAIARLPDREFRSRQRTHFDALSLLAVFVQHGDRKRSQQRVVCRDGLDAGAGDVRALSPGDRNTPGILALFERPAARACRNSVVTIQDLGATFGGAGQLSRSVGATAHLKSWAQNKIFAPPVVDRRRFTEPKTCHGNVIVANTAGDDAREDPMIGEAGRKHLATLLSRLTDDHIRALFEASRVAVIEGNEVWRNAGTEYRGLDAWIAVFKQKRAEIESTVCPE